MAGEVDRDFAFAFGGLAEVHFRAERGAQLLFEGRDLLIARARDWSRIAVGIDDPKLIAVECVDAILHALFRRADGKAILLDLSRELDLFLFVAQGEQRAGVALRDVALLNHLFHGRPAAPAGG